MRQASDTGRASGAPDELDAATQGQGSGAEGVHMSTESDGATLLSHFGDRLAHARQGLRRGGSRIEAMARRTARRDLLVRLRRMRRLRSAFLMALVLIGPALMAATYAVMGPLGRGAASTTLRLVVLADLVYILILGGVVLYRLAKMIVERRHAQAGSRLHLRLVGAFTLLTLVPTVLVAIFAGLTLSVGLEGWFSGRVQQVVETSRAAAEAYQEEQRQDLSDDARALSAVLSDAAQSLPFIDDGLLRQFLTQGQLQIQRGLREAYIIDGQAQIRARGERSYLFWYEEPDLAQITAARRDGILLIEDWERNEFRALVVLDGILDRMLYVTRDVDGALLSLVDETRETAGLYERLESERGRLLLEFTALYVAFALLLVAGAVWTALWFAERLSRPIGKLAEAAEQVGRGDLDVQIAEASTGDEIQTLGENFNRMTRQLKTQRSDLVTAMRDIDERRQLFDSVLSSVTSGVVGLNADGRIDFVNRSAVRLLDLKHVEGEKTEGLTLSEAVPEFAPLFARLEASVAETVQDEVRLTRSGRVESLLVRVARRANSDGEFAGHVVAFEDVTELVSAQRMAAWGDVARRVAHEIKNPLTPIQLSAERVRRKFGPMVDEESREKLTQYVDVIIRQTHDLRRIVDEFSRFARMPEPDRKPMDIAALTRDTALLQRDALGRALQVNLPEQPAIVNGDPGMLGQVLTNLLKNAGEAVDERRSDAPEGWKPRIVLNMTQSHDAVIVTITDNGVGLPADRSRLFDPYVTLKSSGTGLGLSICKKIVEEHGGSLSLYDAPKLEGGGRGACAKVVLPRAKDRELSSKTGEIQFQVNRPRGQEPEQT